MSNEPAPPTEPDPVPPPAEEPRPGRTFIDALSAPEGESPPEITTRDVFSLLDKLDEDQVIAELTGREDAALRVLVYQFEQDGKIVAGLSKRGIDEAARELAKGNQCLRELEITYQESADFIDAIAKVGRVLVNGDGRETLLETKFGTKRQAKMARARGGREYEDKFVFEKACSKALRNALRRLIPEEIVASLIDRVLALDPDAVKKVDKAAKSAGAKVDPKSEIPPELVQQIQIGFKALNIQEGERRGLLSRMFGVDSVLKLSMEQATKVLDDLRTLYRAKKAQGVIK